MKRNSSREDSFNRTGKAYSVINGRLEQNESVCKESLDLGIDALTVGEGESRPAG